MGEPVSFRHPRFTCCGSAALTALLCLAGCTPRGDVLRAELETGARPGRFIPLGFVRQRPDGCGSAVLSEVLAHWDAPGSGEAELSAEVYSPSLRAALNTDLAEAARRRGLVVRSGRSGGAELRRAIETGYPAVVMITLSPHVLGRRHFLAVKGVDSERGYLLADDGRQADVVLRPRPFRRDWRCSGFWALYCWPADRAPEWSSANEDLQAGIILEGTRRLDDAVLAYARAVGKNARLWEAAFNLGNVCLAQSRPADAEKHYRRALELAPEEPDVLNNLAAALLAAGRSLEEAERLARRARDLSPPGSAARIRSAHTLGFVLRKQSRPAESRETLRSALTEAEEAGMADLAAELRRDIEAKEAPLPEPVR